VVTLGGVSRIQKLKRKLRRNPRGIRFGELVRVLESLGYQEARSSGSHHIFRPAGQGPSILVVKPHGGRTLCAMVDVEKVIALLEEEEIDGQG
jgi:predicted RNA binding protein YcfA (HicA-like mRNA interferase family)